MLRVMGVALVFAVFGITFLAATPHRVRGEEEPAGAAAVSEPGGSEASATKPAESSRLMWWIRSSGLIGLFILLLSIYFVATVIRLFIELRTEVAAPVELVERCEELITRREFAEIYGLVKGSDSFLGRALATGLAELPCGLAEARDVMERMGETETVDMEKRISMLAVLGTLGPMIGLIGTLKGMISSFSVIAISDVQLKASQVAGGISEALILTFEGVALSVPAIYFYAVFRNRVSSISSATMYTADQLLRRFAHAVRVKSPPAPAPPASATAPRAKD